MACNYVIIASVVLAVVIQVHVSAFILGDKDLCGYLINITCPLYSGGLACGTNNVTYDNDCEFTKAMCKDRNIKYAHPGPCTHEMIEQDLVLNVTCSDIFRLDCYTFHGNRKICGSDHTTYQNQCFFEKARCRNHGLHLSTYGDCQ